MLHKTKFLFFLEYEEAQAKPSMQQQMGLDGLSTT